MNTMTAPHEKGTLALDSPRVRAHLTPGISFARLAQIETRKTIDTRAGLWLLIMTAALTTLVMGIAKIWGPEDFTYQDLVTGAAMPLGIFVPILGTLAATSEWSQRTGLVTFALEPRRGRVVAAKLVASVALIIGLYAVTLACAAALHLTRDAVPWAWSTPKMAGFLLVVVLGAMQGSAFGFAFLNTPAAIVASLLLPTLWTGVSILVKSLDRFTPWVDMLRTTEPLMNGSISATQWAQLASSVGLWIILPLAVGIWRVLHSEVK